MKKKEQNTEHPGCGKVSNNLAYIKLEFQKGRVTVRKGRGSIWRIIAENFPKLVKTTKQGYRNHRG